jgi:hypothetical protein
MRQMRSLPVLEIWKGTDPAQMTNWCEKRFVDEFAMMVWIRGEEIPWGVSTARRVRSTDGM